MERALDKLNWCILSYTYKICFKQYIPLLSNECFKMVSHVDNICGEDFRFLKKLYEDSREQEPCCERNELKNNNILFMFQIK